MINDTKPEKFKGLDELFHEVGTYRQSSNYGELMNFIRKFPKIAPYNAFLIHVQRPGSGYVASHKDWKKKFGRTVKAEARPLVILQNFGPVRFVFELSDTEGENIPEEILNPFKPKGQLPSEEFHRLLNNLPRDGIQYVEATFGKSQAGLIQYVMGNKFLYFRNTKTEHRYNLVVNDSHSREEKFATMCHELGHLYCGHLGTLNDKWWPDRQNLNLNAREFEAESVAWLICERCSIKNPSAAYLQGYLESNREIPQISLDTVLKAAGLVESMMQRQLEVRKEKNL